MTMKKNIFLMLAAILTCGTMFTACSAELDYPVAPTPDPGPDEAGMFIQNVLSDSRYKMTSWGEISEGEYYLRLDVNSYEEAMAEFHKLLPEGVAATAFEYEDDTEFGVESIIGYSLNAPRMNDKDSIAICKTVQGLEPVGGYAQVYLTPDISEALHVSNILYMPASNDDLDILINSITNVLPYSKIDPDDTGHLICTASRDESLPLLLSFFTESLVAGSTLNDNNETVFTLVDKQGNKYGHMIVPSMQDAPENVMGILLFDDELKANMEKKLKIGFSKLTFIVKE